MEKSQQMAGTLVTMVAWFMILSSICLLLGAIAMIFLRGSFFLNISDILNLAAGGGLLRRSRGWRIYLLIYWWITVVALGGTIAMRLFGASQFSRGAPIGPRFLVLMGVLAVLYAACLIIMHSRPVRALFRPSCTPEEPPKV